MPTAQFIANNFLVERRRLACSEREARIMDLRFSRLRRSVQASRLRSIGLRSVRSLSDMGALFERGGFG